MSRGEEIFGQIQKKARTDGAETRRRPPTAEYLTRHALESFLARLTQTEHGENFVLKGGILLAAYGARRPTKDVDAEAISSSVTADNIAQILSDVAEVQADDGLEFDLSSLDVQKIREDAEYPGLRVRVHISIGTFSGKVLWDISTGDPIVPMPKTVKVPRVLGDDIEMLGYAPETVLAEKGVTILERGTTSTRWRDYVDIVRLAATYAIDEDLLLASAQSPTTAESTSHPSARCSTATEASRSRSGRHGDARKDSKTSATRASTHRSPRPPQSLIPPSPAGTRQPRSRSPFHPD